MALTLQQSFEGIPDTNTVSVGNSGTTPDNAFTNVSITGSTTLVALAAAAMHGNEGMRVTGDGTAGDLAYVEWSGQSAATFAHRFYFRMVGSALTASPQIFQGRTASANVLRIGLNTTPKLLVQVGSAGTTAYTSTTTLVAGTWYRIELQVSSVSATVGQVSFQLYAGDSATALETFTSGSTLNLGGSNLTTLRHILSVGSAGTADFDDLAFQAATTTPIGPANSPVTGTATFTGTGTLAVTGTPATTGTPALTGTGTLGVTGTPATTGPVTLAGNGTLAATGTPATNGTAALSGTGTLNAAGTPTPHGSIGLSGTGTLAITGAPSFTGNIALNGTGTLGVAAGGFSGTATFTGNGTLVVAGVPRVTGTVALNGSGTLTQNGAPNIAGAAAYAGAGTLSIQGAPRINGTAAFTGVGVLLVINSSTLRDITLTALPIAQRFTTLSLPDRLTGTRLPDRIASQSLNSRITTDPLPYRFITTPEVS